MSLSLNHGTYNSSHFQDKSFLNLTGVLTTWPNLATCSVDLGRATVTVIGFFSCPWFATSPWFGRYNGRWRGCRCNVRWRHRHGQPQVRMRFTRHELSSIVMHGNASCSIDNVPRQRMNCGHNTLRQLIAQLHTNKVAWLHRQQVTYVSINV